MRPGQGGSRRRPRLPSCAARLAVGLAALLPAASAGAACVTEPARIVELDARACRPAALAVEQLASGSQIWWLWEYMTSIARQVPGVLVRGEVTRWRRYEPPQTLGPWRRGGGEEEYFYPSLDPEFCATFEPLDSILLVREQPCCDLIPPVDVACLLELPQARSPTPLERELAADDGSR